MTGRSFLERLSLRGRTKKAPGLAPGRLAWRGKLDATKNHNYGFVGVVVGVVLGAGFAAAGFCCAGAAALIG